jgi:hypothetical protein
MVSVDSEMNDPHAIVRELINQLDVETKSDLTGDMCMSFAKGRILAMAFGSDMLTKFLDDLMILRISKDRKGRTEIVESMKNRFTEAIQRKGDLHLLG